MTRKEILMLVVRIIIMGVMFYMGFLYNEKLEVNECNEYIYDNFFSDYNMVECLQQSGKTVIALPDDRETFINISDMINYRVKT